MRSEWAKHIELGSVRYSYVWEDHLLLEKALDITPHDDVLVIASAGCNALNLLLAEPRSVTAIDLNPAQAAFVELKCSAIESLSHDAFVAFLGLRPSAERWATYEKLRPLLGTRCARFWDESKDAIEGGILHCGRLDQYIATFRSDVLARHHDEAAVRRLFECENLQQQAEYFNNALATEAFVEDFKIYFGAAMMAKQGRDPSQFRYVEEGDVGSYFWSRIRYAATELPAEDNSYLELFLTGGIADLSKAPAYLRPCNHERLQSLLPRLRVVVDELERFVDASPAGSLSKVGLSDMFEYVSEEQHKGILKALATTLGTGGRIAYWNLLVPRACPSDLEGTIETHDRQAQSLWREDRAWFYRAFHVESVR